METISGVPAVAELAPAAGLTDEGGTSIRSADDSRPRQAGRCELLGTRVLRQALASASLLTLNTRHQRHMTCGDRGCVLQPSGCTQCEFRLTEYVPLA